ncbi:AIPR family protein [Geodermatophilus sp. SYSU D01176]
MSLLHVRQIETFLRSAYTAELWQDTLDDSHNLSRLLARYAIDLSMGERARDGSALVEITDSGGDRGIDAIAVDPTTSLVVVVQSKWRGDGSGSVDLGSVLKFLDGVRALLDIGATGPSGCSETAREAVRQAMQTPGGRLRMIVATTASNDLSDEVKRPVLDLLEILNDVSEDHPIADFSCLTQSAFFESLARPARTAIDLDIPVLDWGRTTDPAVAYYGRVSALTVAEWFQRHGSDLFAENIRVVLPRSEINEGILRTVREDPERFWYYNNGITILATRIERSLAGSANRDAGFFKAVDASVVNGAQTVSTLGRALSGGEDEALGRAYVSVRCIEVAEDSPELARRITRFANTQNVVSSQDFVFLDEEQHRLVKELRLLGFEYLLRSGEVPTLRDRSKVIDVRMAAVALACASPSMGHAVTAKREVSRLFDRESGPYSALFNPSVNGLLVHRSVEVVRRVDTILDQESRAGEGVRSGVAVHGNRVIAHVLLKRLGRARLLDPSFDFATASGTIEEGAVALLAKLADVFPPNSYPGNVFKNQSRSAELVAAAESQPESAAS